MFAHIRHATTAPAWARVLAAACRRQPRSNDRPTQATDRTAGRLNAHNTPVDSSRRRHARQRPVMFAAALAVCALGGAVGPSLAQAGTWTLVSCTQPDGQVAPIDGWTSVAFDGGGNYSSASNSCGTPGGGLFATSSSAWPQTRGTGWMWQFDAPAGATISGGTMNVMLTSPVGQAFVLTPNFTYDGADVVVNCQFNVPCGSNGAFTGTVPIDHPGGTSLYAGAMCLGPGQPGQANADCAQGDGVNGVNVQIAVYAAQIELTDDTAPTGTGFSGPLLAPDARGPADVLFTAGDPERPRRLPGQRDRRRDHRLPRHPRHQRRRMRVDRQRHQRRPRVPLRAAVQAVRERRPADRHDRVHWTATHTLKITVTDAAQNQSVVYDGTITHPERPRKHGRAGIDRSRRRPVRR